MTEKSCLTKEKLEELRRLVKNKVSRIDREGNSNEKKKKIHYQQIEKTITNMISYCMLMGEYPTEIKPFKKKEKIGYEARFGDKIHEFL